ncbi:MAG: hypothetical protein LUI85_06405 [Bacteroides sp.]|nr:hypothetical protein [Bacteroides sp.]
MKPDSFNVGNEEKFGGWSPMTPVKEEDLKIFNDALDGLKGVTYVPESVSKQIVAGINYRFLCSATSITDPHTHYQAMVGIFFDAKTQRVLLTDITRID